jgi:hypothetical protein
VEEGRNGGGTHMIHSVDSRGDCERGRGSQISSVRNVEGGFV